MLPIIGKPILAYVIERIEQVEAIDEIIIVTNEKFYDYFKNGLKGYQGKLPIQILNDGTLSNEDRLGAIGDIKFVIDELNLDDDIVVVAGDNIFDFNLVHMYNRFLELECKHPVICIYDVRTFEEAKKYGVVDISPEGKILNFVEKPENPKSTLCSTAIYFYPKDVMKLIPQYIYDGNSPDAPGYLLQWLYKIEDVYGYTYDKRDYDWFDIGDLTYYQQANQLWEVKVRKPLKEENQG